MKKRSSSALLISAAAFLLLAGSPAHAAFQWNRNVNGTHSWSTGTNWLDGVAPDLVEDEEIFLRDVSNTTSLTDITILLDIGAEEEEQVLRGGLVFSGYNNWNNPFKLNVDLNGKRLVLDGSYLSMWREAGASVEANTLAFSNGTLQVGTATRAATIDLGKNYASDGVSTAAQANALKIEAGATFDSFNVANLYVAASNAVYYHQYAFDLSEATLVSGAEQRTLKAANAIAVGVTLGNGSQYNMKRGELKLGDLSRLESADFLVGQSNEANSTSTEGRMSEGTVRFSANQTTALEMNVSRHLRIGAGKNSIGKVLDAPAELHLTVGSASTPLNQRGVFQVGYKNLSGSFNRTKDTTSGEFIAGGGSFNAYVSGLKIGVNDYTVGTVDGTVDFSQMELGVLDIDGDAVIGSGLDATGQLALSGGQVFSENLVLGTTTESTSDPLWTLARSGLSLDGTLWTIESNLTIGGMGDLELRLGPDPSAAGLDIGLGLTLEDGGTLAIHFDTAASDEMFWGLRIAGNDHGDLLTGYIEADQLLALGEFGAQASVFTDEHYTYYGIAAIPEPGFATLCGAGLLILLAPRLRRLRLG